MSDWEADGEPGYSVPFTTIVNSALQPTSANHSTNNVFHEEDGKYLADLPTVQGFPVQYRDFAHFGCSVQAYRDLVHLYRDFLVETNLLIVS